jgi:hypothetical protein
MTQPNGWIISITYKERIKNMSSFEYKDAAMNDREVYEHDGAVWENPDIISPPGYYPQEKIESYKALQARKLEVTAELEKCQSQRAMLERENEYLMATLHDIREGLDALHWHIQVANGVPEYFDPNPAFIEAWKAVKITHTELRNIVDEWESKWVSPEDELPF